MVIQRLQNLYLLVAALLVTVYAFMESVIIKVGAFGLFYRLPKDVNCSRRIDELSPSVDGFNYIVSFTNSAVDSKI